MTSRGSSRCSSSGSLSPWAHRCFLYAMLSAAASTVVVDELSRPSDGPRGEESGAHSPPSSPSSSPPPPPARSVQLQLGSVAAERRSRQQHRGGRGRRRQQRQRGAQRVSRRDRRSTPQRGPRGRGRSVSVCWGVQKSASAKRRVDRGDRVIVVSPLVNRHVSRSSRRPRRAQPGKLVSVSCLTK